MLDLSGHCRTSSASSGSQWARPHRNRELQIALGTAGPQTQAPELSGHCRTATASSRCQRAAGPQPRAPELSGHCQHCRTSTASSTAQRTLPHCRTSTGEYGACDMKRKNMEKYEASCGAAHSWLRGRTELGRRAKQAVRQAVMTAKKSSRS